MQWHQFYQKIFKFAIFRMIPPPSTRHNSVVTSQPVGGIKLGLKESISLQQSTNETLRKAIWPEFGNFSASEQDEPIGQALKRLLWLVLRIGLEIKKTPIMLLCRETSIRDVIAFPKTQKAACLLTNAPSVPAKAQLDELHLRVKLTSQN
jgi:hypothetical protein